MSKENPVAPISVAIIRAGRGVGAEAMEYKGKFPGSSAAVRVSGGILGLALIALGATLASVEAPVQPFIKLATSSRRRKSA